MRKPMSNTPTSLGRRWQNTPRSCRWRMRQSTPAKSTCGSGRCTSTAFARRAIGSTDTRPDADAVVVAEVDEYLGGEEADRIVRPFELAMPRSLVEAIDLLDHDDPAVRPIGGG